MTVILLEMINDSHDRSGLSVFLPRDISKAGLLDILCSHGANNIQGEVQMKLDLYANNILKAELKARGQVAGFASEEENIVIFEGERAEKARYVVLMDPLDGSSNIDVNVSVGSIFSIYRRITPIGQSQKKIFYNDSQSDMRFLLKLNYSLLERRGV